MRVLRLCGEFAFPCTRAPPPGVPMKHPGQLKVYLGYAAGVGKTYRMLDEAQALRAQGVDIAIGYFEPHGRQETDRKSVV